MQRELDDLGEQEQDPDRGAVSIFTMHGKRGYSVKVTHRTTEDDLARMIDLALRGERKVTQTL